jgi:1,4-dihydroxy-2-naphthoate octaprenyltransferase
VALACAVLLQIATNFWNDYADHVRGADTAQRVGPLRATQAGLISASTMRAAALATFGAAGLASLYLVWRGGWPLAVLAVLSILSGLAYTGGPRPLGYLGLGDLFVLVFFGPVAVAGTYYVQTLHFHPAPALAGVGPGALAVAILVVNNLRDIATDAPAGKRTLAVRFGPTFARLEYTACFLVAGLIPLALWKLGWAPANVALAGLSVVGGWRPFLRVWLNDGERLNPGLAQTALLLLVYSFIFSAGWLV